MEDNFGFPGKVLETFNDVEAPRRQTNAPAPLLVLKSVLEPKLRGESKYWLCVGPADARTAALWRATDQRSPYGFGVGLYPGNRSVINARLMEQGLPKVARGWMGAHNGAFRVVAKTRHAPTPVPDASAAKPGAVTKL